MHKKDLIKYTWEYTDLMGGEANYSWVRHGTFEAPADASDALIMRRAKKAAGLNGCRGRRSSCGDTLEFRPARSCTVLFVYVEY